MKFFLSAFHQKSAVNENFDLRRSTSLALSFHQKSNMKVYPTLLLLLINALNAQTQSLVDISPKCNVNLLKAIIPFYQLFSLDGCNPSIQIQKQYSETVWRQRSWPRLHFLGNYLHQLLRLYSITRNRTRRSPHL